mmetsp:Transcript_48715/g.59925  ORF Transcript_48715/g.59925 Transcript_48715/m.59925 type:complete len:277 (-) Transcript_48715:18-848(-)
MVGIRSVLFGLIYALCVISIRRDCNYINFYNNQAPYIMKGHPLNICLGFSVNEQEYGLYTGGMTFSCNENNTGVNMLIYDDGNCNPDGLKATVDVSEYMTFPGINTSNINIQSFTWNTSSWECNLSNDCEYFEYTIFATESVDQCVPSTDTWFRSAFLSNACISYDDHIENEAGSAYYSCDYDRGILSWNTYYVSSTCDGIDLRSGEVPTYACFNGGYAGYSMNHCPNNSTKSHKLRNTIIILSVIALCLCITTRIACCYFSKKKSSESDHLITKI